MPYYNGEPVDVIAEKDGWSYCEVGTFKLKMWLPKDEVVDHIGFAEVISKNTPHLLTVDSFYSNPDKIRKLALGQDYKTSSGEYKGLRTKERFLWPNLKERFESLLNKKIVDWLDQKANGCFQITGYNDPLVWHSDFQNYAAAIYLTPDAPLEAGTSFWRSKIGGCRRPPNHPLELPRFDSKEEALSIHDEIYNTYNFIHQDNWELVDRIGAVYNRLVIWDGQLIHSASNYQDFVGDSPESSRLVQLFFFNVA